MHDPKSLVQRPLVPRPHLETLPIEEVPVQAEAVPECPPRGRPFETPPQWTLPIPRILPTLRTETYEWVGRWLPPSESRRTWGGSWRRRAVGLGVALLAGLEWPSRTLAHLG